MAERRQPRPPSAGSDTSGRSLTPVRTSHSEQQRLAALQAGELERVPSWDSEESSNTAVAETNDEDKNERCRHSDEYTDGAAGGGARAPTEPSTELPTHTRSPTPSPRQRALQPERAPSQPPSPFPPPPAPSDTPTIRPSRFIEGEASNNPPNNMNPQLPAGFQPLAPSPSTMPQQAPAADPPTPELGQIPTPPAPNVPPRSPLRRPPYRSFERLDRLNTLNPPPTARPPEVPSPPERVLSPETAQVVRDIQPAHEVLMRGHLYLDSANATPSPSEPETPGLVMADPRAGARGRRMNGGPVEPRSPMDNRTPLPPPPKPERSPPPGTDNPADAALMQNDPAECIRAHLRVLAGLRVQMDILAAEGVVSPLDVPAHAGPLGNSLHLSTQIDGTAPTQASAAALPPPSSLPPQRATLTRWEATGSTVQELHSLSMTLGLQRASTWQPRVTQAVEVEMALLDGAWGRLRDIYLLPEELEGVDELRARGVMMNYRDRDFRELRQGVEVQMGRLRRVSVVRKVTGEIRYPDLSRRLSEHEQPSGQRPTEDNPPPQTQGLVRRPSPPLPQQPAYRTPPPPFLTVPNAVTGFDQQIPNPAYQTYINQQQPADPDSPFASPSPRNFSRPSPTPLRTEHERHHYRTGSTPLSSASATSISPTNTGHGFAQEQGYGHGPLHLAAEIFGTSPPIQPQAQAQARATPSRSTPPISNPAANENVSPSTAGMTSSGQTIYPQLPSVPNWGGSVFETLGLGLETIPEGVQVHRDSTRDSLPSLNERSRRRRGRERDSAGGDGDGEGDDDYADKRERSPAKRGRVNGNGDGDWRLDAWEGFGRGLEERRG